MSDAMQVAHQNRKSHTKAIAQKEAEIAELREMIADLDSFIEFGNSLLGQAPAPVEEAKGPRKVSQPTSQVEQNWNSGDADAGIASVLSKRAG